METKSPVTLLQPNKPVSTVRTALVGQSKASESLEPVFAEALLRTSYIRFNMKRWDEKRGIGFIASLPHPIHHIEVVCGAPVRCCGPPKPPPSQLRRRLEEITRATRLITTLEANRRSPAEYCPMLHVLESLTISLTLKSDCSRSQCHCLQRMQQPTPGSAVCDLISQLRLLQIPMLFTSSSHQLIYHSTSEVSAKLHMNNNNQLTDNSDKMHFDVDICISMRCRERCTKSTADAALWLQWWHNLVSSSVPV